MLNACLVNVLLASSSLLGQGQPIIGVPAPAPAPSDVLPAPTLLAPAAPLRLCDFAKGFVPVCGHYEVVFCHPVSGCPVKVCFDLPPGCPKVHVHKRSLEFDYGRHSVTIRFQLLHSKVKVKYT